MRFDDGLEPRESAAFSAESDVEKIYFDKTQTLHKIPDRIILCVKNFDV